MVISVLFFGLTADVTGRRQIEIELPGGTKVGDIFDRLLTDYPRLSSHPLLFSVNQQYASGEELVSDGDELAVFTAVSGG